MQRKLRFKHLMLYGFLAVTIVGIIGFGWYSYADAQSGQTVYDDSLQGDWVNWSWGTSIDFSNNNPVHTGSNSMSVQYNHRWAGVFLHTNSNLNSDDYDALRFCSPTKPFWAIRQGKWKLVAHRDMRLLSDMEADPTESTSGNLAGKHPEIVERLEKLHAKMRGDK